MFKKGDLFDFQWDVDKYKKNYDPEHWDLCKIFMVTHKTKYSEQKLVHLTEAFYQIGVYGSSYDHKTTRMVSALAIEVLDSFLKSHPGTLRHPFNKSLVVTPEVADTSEKSSTKKDGVSATVLGGSIWDVCIDKNIIANVLVMSQLKVLLKGFIIIYDIRRESTMNDNKVSILEESFKRSKFGPCHWNRDDTHNNICPIRMNLKWKGTVLAEAEGADDKKLQIRLAQALLSKLATFSPGVMAKWSYYRDGKMPDLFDYPNPRKSNIYKVIPRSQFKAMAEITSFIDTFANSDSFAEVVFGMDFSSSEKKQMIDYISKSWGTKLTYRTVNKMGVKSKGETHLCVYQIRTGEELKRWLDQCGGDNERYRLLPPGDHRRAGGCDNNVREVLTRDIDDKAEQIDTIDLTKEKSSREATEVEEADYKMCVEAESQKDLKNGGTTKQKETVKSNICGEKDQELERVNQKDSEVIGSDLSKLLDGFVLFYNAKRNSEIDKDDWFSALCDSFKMSKFGPLEVISDNIRPLRTRCVLKWNNKTLASAEGLTETQAKTAATLQLISRLEPFTYIIQAKEEYFCSGKVPPFLENPDPNKSDIYRVVRRKDLPSYYSIFQTLDEFAKKESDGELVFGADFMWELKNEIVVYLKAKGLDYRYFTAGDQKPWSHMAVYHSIDPEKLKDLLIKSGGENEKYKLIPPQKAEPSSNKTIEEDAPKVSENPPKIIPTARVVEKRKQSEKEPSPNEELEINKIQIKLKKFKKDKVDYPEDTGGDFPGLILWVGIRKNSVLQKNLFCIVMESFKFSKFGELNVEESNENVWGRKEPLKKCVIKSNRKVLAVGLGESKAEAKLSASMQVLRQLRSHCYTIQAKDSYFKNGKATPYDFNPDPAKEHVYTVVKRNQFKDQAAITMYVDEFSKNVCSKEIIFGDDFTYDERENILTHCRQIKLGYRFIKSQSISKGMHTHVAIYHQRPPPVVKAELTKAGGVNDMYRLIPPGGKITNQSDETDLWPDTLENGQVEVAKTTHESLNPIVTRGNDRQLGIEPPAAALEHSREEPDNSIETPSEDPLTNSTLLIDFKDSDGDIDNFEPNILIVDSKSSSGQKIPVLSGRELNLNRLSNSYLDTEEKKKCLESVHDLPYSQPMNLNHPQQMVYDVPLGPQNQSMNYSVGPQPMNYTPIGPQPPLMGFDVSTVHHPQPIEYHAPMGLYPQPMNYQPVYPQEILGPAIQEIPFGPQPFYTPAPLPMHGSLQEMPLQFGPQPQPPVQHSMATKIGLPQLEVHQSINVTEQMSLDSTKEGDLRDELTKMRQTETLHRETSDRKVYALGMERDIVRKDDTEQDIWSRKVFVGDPNDANKKSSDESEDLRLKLRQRNYTKSSSQQRTPDERNIHKISGQDHQRKSVKDSPTRVRQRTSPDIDRRRPLSVRREHRRFSSGRDKEISSKESSRNKSLRKSRRLSEERILRTRDSSFEGRCSRKFSRDRSRNYSRDRIKGRRSVSRSRRSPLSFSDEIRFRRGPSPVLHFRDLWDNIDERFSENIFMYKYVRQDSTTETEPFALLRATRSLDFNIDFDFIHTQIAIDEWRVSVELVTDDTSTRPLVGEGKAETEGEARLIAASHAVETIQRACRVIEPNYSYFAEGGMPEFIVRKSPIKTPVYEIIQNMDSATPLSRYTIEVMCQVFLTSEMEDLFFLATDFSYLERVLVIEVANKFNLWWRLFGPRHPDAKEDDVVSTQHVCVSKEQGALSLIRQLMNSGGSTLKYTLVEPHEARRTRPGDWSRA